MDVIDQCRFVGFEPDGTRRVFGTGSSPDIAETRCKEAAADYVGRRPDTGPLDRWTFERDR